MKRKQNGVPETLPAWDAQNRMVSCVTGGVTSTFTYGADGLRRSMTVDDGVNPPVTTKYLLDGQNVIREIVGENVTATYLNGYRGIEYREDANGEKAWYLYDGLGCVIGEMADDGTMTATRTYKAFGAVQSATGNGVSNHKFCGSLGHTADDSTGLTYMRARYYDPVIGRFISEDPKRDSANWYTYCYDNPVSASDSSGEIVGEDVLAEEVVAASAAVGAGGALVQRIQVTMYAWGAQIIAALEGAEEIVVKAIPGRGVVITNGIRQVFIDLVSHPGEAHFDVQSKMAGWPEMWRQLYAEITHLRF